ncbi:hypothetical protein KVT40_003390 [Elsinoe batatas]|uniref:Uncharacterized protein n=1 Tax=Elsinoe batatas TaxID=2601811 RepID=A0A8K0L611_9PEZI|nr:hypothetical protein KVT40_003390 [Elsinoe batatas]
MFTHCSLSQRGDSTFSLAFVTSLPDLLNMHFTLLALPAFAMLANAATTEALSTTTEVPSTTTAAPTSDDPVTLEDRASAVDAILSAMKFQYSRDHPATSAAKPTAVTTTKKPSNPKGGKKTSSAKPPKKTSSSKKGKKQPKKTPKASKAVSTGKPESSVTATTEVGPTPTVSITPTVSKVSKVRRQNVNNACAQQPILYTYTPSVPAAAAATDVIAPIGAFLRDTNLINSASSVSTIDGFTTIFSGLLGVAQKPLYYMFYTDMSSYNATACGEICKNTNGCRSFNMYFERSPSLAPASSCPNPNAYTAVRCAFYSTFIKATDVVNSGQWRQDFGVVITGANGYRRVF